MIAASIDKHTSDAGTANGLRVSVKSETNPLPPAKNQSPGAALHSSLPKSKIQNLKSKI